MKPLRLAALAPAALALTAAALAPSLAEAKPPPDERTHKPIRDEAFDPFETGPDGVADVAMAPRLPAVSPPPPLETGRTSAKLSWSYEAEGLRVVGAEGLPPDQSPQFKRLRLASSTRPKARKKKATPPARHPETETAWVRVEGASMPTLVAFAWQAPESNFTRALSMPCRPWLEAPVRWPLRWESVHGDESGTPLWQVNDGWYDEKSCQISLERRTALRPAVLVRQGQAPVVLAAREDDAVIFLVAPTRSLLTHDLGGGARTTQGPFARVRVPVGPGLASTVVASFPPASLSSWWKRPNAPPSFAQLHTEPSVIEVRVDVSQAVAEREPTLAIQRVTDRPELNLPVPPPARPIVPQQRSQQETGGGQAAMASLRVGR